jgi:hypothetical protein
MKPSLPRERFSPLAELRRSLGDSPPMRTFDRGCVKTIDGLISRMERAKKTCCGSILFTFLG